MRGRKNSGQPWWARNHYGTRFCWALIEPNWENLQGQGVHTGRCRGMCGWRPAKRRLQQPSFTWLVPHQSMVKRQRKGMTWLFTGISCPPSFIPSRYHSALQCDTHLMNSITHIGCVISSCSINTAPIPTVVPKQAKILPTELQPWVSPSYCEAPLEQRLPQADVHLGRARASP